MDEKKTPVLDMVSGLVTTAIIGIELFIMLDSYTRRNGGGGLKSAVVKRYENAVKPWREKKWFERAKNEVIVEAWVVVDQWKRNLEGDHEADS